jgi:hypothetical protein
LRLQRGLQAADGFGGLALCLQHRRPLQHEPLGVGVKQRRAGQLALRQLAEVQPTVQAYQLHAQVGVLGLRVHGGAQVGQRFSVLALTQQLLGKRAWLGKLGLLCARGRRRRRLQLLGEARQRIPQLRIEAQRDCSPKRLQRGCIVRLALLGGDLLEALGLPHGRACAQSPDLDGVLKAALFRGAATAHSHHKLRAPRARELPAQGRRWAGELLRAQPALLGELLGNRVRRAVPFYPRLA